MRHHVGGTHNDEYGHGHESGPMYKVDLHTMLEREQARKRTKKYERFLRHRRSVAPVQVTHREEVARKREDKRTFVQRATEKVKGFVTKLFGRKTG
jgi:hypothetical protein